jgi:PAS domain S-box-containing protein
VISVPLLVLAAVMEERRRGEVSLRESEERFSLAFRLSPVAFAITRRHDGRILDVNERWEAMLGHPRTEVVGRSIAGLGMFLHPDEAQRFMDRLSSDGAVRDLELELRNRAGALRRTVLTAQSVTLADEPCFLIAVRDITDRRRVQAELDEQRAELAHLARVSLVGELSAALAHELNQPLAAIMANARAGQRLMTRQPPDVPEVRSILEDVTDDARRAGQVISRLHALLKRGELQLNPVDLNEVVSEVLELVHSELIQREVVVETRLAGALPRVPGDRVQLQQVLINLLLNACDAMSAEPRERRRVLITTVGNNGAVVLSVADQGVGIPDGKLEQVFEPLYTSKPHGLGLGLSICRTIVTAHGGRLWAAHNPDHGATFHLLLGQEDGKVL